MLEYTSQEKESDLGLYYYGARFYDPDTGRFLSVDAARQYWNSYSYVGNNPIVSVDPTGLEDIVVTGGEYDDPERYKYNFIEASINQLKQYKQNNPVGTVTWLLMDTMYSNEDVNKFSEIASDLGVNFVTLNSSDELLNYFNSKSPVDSQMSHARSSDLVMNFSVFAHGTPEAIEFSYGPFTGIGIDPSFSFGHDLAFKLNSNAFGCDAVGSLFSCRPAMGSVNYDVSLARAIFNSAGLRSLMAWVSKTDYAKINAGESYLSKYNRWKNKFNTEGSKSLPSGSGGTKPKIFERGN